MGQETSAPEITPNVASPDGNGKQSVMTASLDEHYTEEQFWQGIGKFFRSDTFLPWTARMVGLGHKIKVKEISPHRWMTNINITTPFGWGVVECCNHFTDRDKHMHTNSVYTDETMKTWKYTLHFKLWHNPLRLEAWITRASERVADKRIDGFFNSTLSYVLEKCNHSLKEAAYNFDVESPSGNGQKSLLTEPLDHLMLPDEFWPHVTEKLKQADAKNLFRPSKVEKIDDQRFLIENRTLFGTVSYHMCTIDRDKDYLTLTEYGEDSNCRKDHATHHVQVYRDPFRVEYFVTTAGGRFAGPLLRKFLIYMFGQMHSYDLRDCGRRVNDGEVSDVWEDAQESIEESFTDLPTDDSDPEEPSSGNSFLVQIGSRRIFCRFARSTALGAQAMVTDRLDRNFDFKTCQEHLTFWCKNAPQADMSQPWECSVDSLYECTITSVINTELAEQVEEMGIANCKGAPIITKSLQNPAQDMLFLLTFLASGPLLFHLILDVRRFPLRVEAWCLDITGEIVVNGIVEQQLGHFVRTLCEHKGLLPDE